MAENGSRPRRVLIADDNDVSRSHTVSVLRAHGYHTVEVNDGAKAIQRICAGTVDVAVVEAELPDRSGLEVVRESARANAGVPMILCTASYNVNRAVEAMKEGAWDVLIKPFHNKDLLYAVAAALQGISLQATWKEHEEKQLQAQKLEVIGRLAGGVVHDFNNLLTVIMGYGEFLKDSLTAGTALRGYAEEIARAAHQGSGLTQQLLAFGRNQPIKTRELDLNEIVGRMQSMLSRLLGAHVQIVTRLAPTLALVRADPSQIEQVILNLAVNARDAMPRGGRLIFETANLELVEPWPELGSIAPGSYVVLTARDTGIGMDAQTRARLFEPFFTTKRQGEGTGLGLTIVASIIDHTGGHITVASEPGKGTVFTIFWPRV